MTPFRILMLLSLAAIWGASFVFVRVAVPALGPVVVADPRVLLAGLLLLGYMPVRGARPGFTRPWRSYMLLGLFNAVAQFTLMAYATERLGASLTAILVATMPLWSAPITVKYFGDRVCATEVIGLIAGICGVVMVVGIDPQPIDKAFVFAVGAALLSALAGAIGGNYARAAFSGESAMAQTIGQQLSAGALLLPMVALAPPVAMPSILQVTALLALALLSTGFAFLIFFRLIAEIGATRTLTVEFLVPVFASFWAWLFLGEKLTPGVIGGGITILIGNGLVNGWQPIPAFLRRKNRRESRTTHSSCRR